MFQSGPNDMTRQRMLQARALSKEARGVGLNLGKKISVPKDVMMEELNLPSNRGSRMFQERQKRVERFTLENAADGAYNTNNVHLEAIPPRQVIPKQQGGKEHQAFSIPGKHSLVMNLQKTVAKKGSPDILAPGYSGPLKEIPHERFNTTVIPKSYCSPWREALGKNEELLNALNAQLPQVPQRLPSASYRCFNSLKINPVSGLHLLGVRLRDGYFEPWLLKDDPLGGLRAVNVPSKTDCARKGITFLMAHKELHHTSEEEQRSAVPFGGALASNRVIPVIGFEAMELQDLPSVSLKSMCQRPSFNRAPRGWGVNQGPESNEL